MAKRLFTLEDANTLVPWLREQFSTIFRLREESAQAAAALQDLLTKLRQNGAQTLDEVVDKQQKKVDRLVKKLQSLLDAVARRGIIVRDPDIGLVDFPSLREGQEVLLCWRADEDRVCYWHTTDAGYAGRQPLL